MHRTYNLPCRKSELPEAVRNGSLLPLKNNDSSLPPIKSLIGGFCSRSLYINLIQEPENGVVEVDNSRVIAMILPTCSNAAGTQHQRRVPMFRCPLHKTFDFEQTFPTYDPAQTGICRIRIFEPNHPSITRQVVIVASQEPASVASVTNFAEGIATDVIASYRKGREISLSQSEIVSQGEIVWIEHYPRGTMLTQHQERFSIVTFQCRPDKTFFDPIWREVSRLFIEQSVLNLFTEQSVLSREFA